MTKKLSVLSLGLSAAVAAFAFGNTPALAGSFNYGNLSSLGASSVKTMIETVGVGADYRSYRSAWPLGMVIGVDIGVDTTFIKMPDAFKTALAAAGNSTKVPSLLPIPRVSAHKGLPFGVDLGGSFMSISGYKLYGGELSYSPLSGGVALPAVQFRVSYNIADASYIKTHTTKFDVVVSKNLFIIDPYIGGGLQLVGGKLDVPVGGTGLPTTVSASASATAGHFFVGLPIKLALLHFTPEYDHSFANGGISTYGMKLSLGF